VYAVPFLKYPFPLIGIPSATGVHSTRDKIRAYSPVFARHAEPSSGFPAFFGSAAESNAVVAATMVRHEASTINDGFFMVCSWGGLFGGGGMGVVLVSLRNV